MKRLDVVLYERRLAPSRQKAKELILGGHVTVNGVVCKKPSFSVGEEDNAGISGGDLRFVGRGGLKLERIIDLCGISLEGLVCMDIGASTGGFTDCMLQNGAAKVYAVDVGSGQLAEKLRADSRVVNMEKTDIRNVSKGDIEENLGFISVDVSFISLKLVLGHVYGLLAEDGTAAVLIKPQFEAGRGNVGKNGIVKSLNTHINVVSDIVSFSGQTGFVLAGICPSPITGAKGNIEYLMCLKKRGESVSPDIGGLVRGAREKLNGVRK